MFLKQRVDQYNRTRSLQICQTIYGRNMCLQGEAIACIPIASQLSMLKLSIVLHCFLLKQPIDYRKF